MRIDEIKERLGNWVKMQGILDDQKNDEDVLSEMQIDPGNLLRTGTRIIGIAFLMGPVTSFHGSTGLCICWDHLMSLYEDVASLV